MFGTIDYLKLLGRDKETFDDESTLFRRISGAQSSSTIVFLPWSMRFEKASQLKILPDNFYCCYELPTGIVSSIPEIPEQCLRSMERAFECDLEVLQARKTPPLLLAMSMGNFPATYFANTHRLDLYSIASGHSGDWLTFHSPAAKHIRLKAERAGRVEMDFAVPLRRLSPINNIQMIGQSSRFLFGTYDRYIPFASREALISKLSVERPLIPVQQIPFGHMATILLWKRFIKMPP